MRKIGVLLYKAKFEWRKVLRDMLKFRKPKVHLVDDAINIYTALFNFPLPGKDWRKRFKEWLDPYSHIELWISDEEGRFVQIHYAGWQHKCKRKRLYREYLGMCYTSTMRNGMAGTVLRPAAEVIKNPSRWDIGVIKGITNGQYKWLMRYINNRVNNNQGYDKVCIADFFNPVRRWFPLHSKLKDICSEAFQGAVRVVGVFLAGYILSPRRIARKLRKMGVVIEPVSQL